MKIVGINDECRNTQMADQLRKIYKVRGKRPSRLKGPAGTRVEVKSGNAVGFVR